MTLNTLKNLRLVVPGLIFVGFLLPLFAPALRISWFKSQLASLQSIYYLCLGCIVGGVYYILGVRSIFVRKSRETIDSNIKHTLLELCLNEPLVAQKRNHLSQGRALMNIFYGFIDGDESLKAKASNVRFNGLLWTSVADSQAMSLLFLVVYPLAYGFTRRPQYLWLSLICLFWALICHFGLMPAVTAKHIRLSNEQLDFMTQNFRERLRERIADAARNLP